MTPHSHRCPLARRDPEPGTPASFPLCSTHHIRPSTHLPRAGLTACWPPLAPAQTRPCGTSRRRSGSSGPPPLSMAPTRPGSLPTASRRVGWRWCPSGCCWTATMPRRSPRPRTLRWRRPTRRWLRAWRWLPTFGAGRTPPKRCGSEMAEHGAILGVDIIIGSVVSHARFRHRRCRRATSCEILLV